MIHEIGWVGKKRHVELVLMENRCPLDRKDLLKKDEKKVVPPPAEDSEEEWDDNYG